MSVSNDSCATTVLVVDDNKADRSLVQSTLSRGGYRVLLADGGAQGLTLFEAERPACVLLEVRLPTLDGFTLCERLRALTTETSMAILFLTALRDLDTFDAAQRAGADDFLTKPVRPADLLARVEAALQLRLAHDELRGHYRLLRQQRDALLRLQLQKERLMAFVVHDLKTPVNTIDLYAQLLLRQRNLPDELREWVMQIRTEEQQLNRMLLDLLDVSRADEGKLSLQRSSIQLGELIERILTEMEPSAQSAQVELRADLAVGRLQADEDLLRRLLANLIENAIRHSPPRASVTVASTAHQGGVELRVVDHGAGVPVTMRARIFDPFVQIEDSKFGAFRGGRGLGLAFCKLAAEAHGGNIRVEDANPGAAFCVWLPAQTRTHRQLQ